MLKWEYCGKNLNTIAADVLVPSVTRSSVDMVLPILYEWVLIFHEKGFQLAAPFQCREMIKNAKIFIHFLK